MINFTARRVSKILDKYLPADAQGTEREQLRMNLHREFMMLIQETQDDRLMAALIRIGKGIFNPPT